MEECEKIYTDFVIEKLKSAGGCLKFQHLTGHLSQLNERVRKRIGNKPAEIMRFLRSRSDLFIVENNGMISLQSSASYGNSCENSSKSNDNLPNYLQAEEGTVIKVLPNYGFIHSKQHKTQVYFPLSSLEESKEGQILTNIIECGKKVLFNARKVNRNGDSKYQATKVWFPKKAENEVLHPEGFSKLRKSRETGLFDPPKMEGTGNIQKVFESYGFIMIDNDPKNTVFFSKKEVRKVENVTDLTKVFKVKDTVDFKAIRSVKKDAKSRWQATQVFVRAQSKPSESRKLEKDVSGKIYPGSKGVVIKFGPSFENIADADSCMFYLHGSKVEDVSWEFSDGDNVKLDVTSIKSSPYWKALLCWVGQRPNVVLKEDLGDFSGLDEMDDITETGSYTSKTSGFSSEKSYNSENSKNTKLSSYTEAQSFSEKPYRDNKRSDFRRARNRSLSPGSRSSLHSQSSSKKFQPTKPKPREYRSQNVHQKFENDSAFGSRQTMNQKKFSPFQQDYSDDDNSTEEFGPATVVEDSKKKMNVKLQKKFSPFQQDYSDDDNSAEEFKPVKVRDSKKAKELPTYTSWADSPCRWEEDNDSDGSLEAPEGNKISNPPLHQESPPPECEKSSPLSDEGDKYESNNEFSSDEANGPLDDVSSEDDSEGRVLPMDDEVESMFKDINDNESAKSEKNVVQPYIRRFRDLESKVRKLFCKYAEIENPKLKKPLNFFWTDFYLKGEQTHDDLRQVLKVGQDVKFDCFEILDDNGRFWNKVTMAWVNVKPKIKEVTPEAFIKENQLVVSVTEVLEDSPEPSNDMTEQPKLPVPPRKFLTVVEDDSDESSDSEPLQATATLKSPEAAASDSFLGKPEDLKWINHLSDWTEAVARDLSSFRNSEADAKKTALGIVNYILFEYNNVKNKNSIDKELETKALTSADKSEDSVPSVSVTDSSVQTIITGEVISLSIFTHG